MDDVERRRSRGWVALGATLLGLLLLLCTCRDSRLIQADLWSKGRAALESKAYDPTLLSFSGRDALLRGEVASEDIKTDMEKTIRAIRGVRQAGLKNELVVATPILELPELRVAMNEGQVTLSGLVPTMTKAEIVAAAEQLYGSASIVDNLQTADNVAAPGWLSSVLGLLPQFKNELPSASLSARDGELTLEGLAASEDIRTVLGLAADNATNLKVNNNIAVAAPVLKPAALTMLLKDGKATLSGVVPEATLVPAVEAAAQMVGVGNVINNLQLATDVEVPVWAPGLLGVLPGLGKQTADLGLAVSNGVLTLSGKVDSSEKRESIAKTLQDAVGETLTIDNKLEVAISVPAQLRFKVMPNAVQLSGILPQLTADRLLELSENISSTGSVINQLSVDQNAKAPVWLPEVLEHLPQFAKEVAEAELNIQEDTITLVGAVPSEAQKVKVEAAVREAVGAEPTIANQLQVVPVLLDPSLSIKFQEDKVKISGSVSQDTADKIEQTFTALEVENTLIATDNIASPDYLTKVIEAVPAYIREVGQAEIDLKDNLLSLSGTVPSEQSKADIANSFSQAAGPAVQIVNDLQVIPPVPAQLQVKVVDGVAQIEGNVPTEVAAEVVDSLPETIAVENQIASMLHVDVPGWLPAIVNVLPRVTTQVKDADVYIVADTITLGGRVSSDEEKTDIEAQVSVAAGPEVKVVNNLVVVPPPLAELKVAVTDGGVEVSGNLPEQTVTPIIESVAQLSATGIENKVVSNPEVDVPAWLPAVVDVLPKALSEVKHADMTILGNTVTLNGSVPSAEEKTSVMTQITKLTGPEVEVVNNLLVEPTPALELRLQVKENGVAIQGNTEEGVKQLAAALEPSVAKVSSEVQAVPEVETPTWLSGVVNILPGISADIQNADIAILDKTVTVAGTVASEAKKTEVEKQITEAATPEVEVINNLQVVEPDPEPIEELPEGTTEAETLTEQATEPVASVPNQETRAGAEDSVDETVEASILEESVEETAVDEPATEASIVEVPTIEGAAEEPPAASSNIEPVLVEEVEEPVIAEPMIEEAVAEEPVVETSMVDEVTEAPIMAEPVTQDLVAETLTTESVTEASIVEDATTEEPVNEPEVAVPAVEETVTEDPMTEVPSVVDPITEASIVEPVVEPGVEESVMEVQQAVVETVVPVDLEPAPVPVLPNPRVRIDIAGSEIRLTGSVPSTTSADLADDGFGNKTIINALQSGEVFDAPWLPKLFGVAPKVADDINRASLMLEDKVLTLQGVVSTPEQRERIGNYVTDAMQPEISVINRLSVETKIPFVEDGK